MAAPKTLSPLEALETFKEHHPDLNTIEKILDIPEDRFVKEYAKFFNGDTRKARKVYHAALQIQEQITLLWANIKDTVASPSLQTTLFNNIPDSFIEHLRSIPSYQQLFGNLDFIECDHSRSIFGPAAYFVDLLRFIEKHIPQESLPAYHRLEDRQPRLFRIPLDHDNTYNLIPYIDLVNEVLEDVIRNNQTSSPYQVLEEAKFPMQLPFHLPLEEIRLYLKQLKTSLQEIYELFGVPEPEIARELLALSPREYSLLKDPITPQTELNAFYGVNDITGQGKDALENVEIFLEKTGLSRPELNELLFLDLSSDEINAGLSRLFFINNTGDLQGHFWIEETIERTLFNIAGGFSSTLNERQLSDSLKQEFQQNNITLSNDAKVLIDRPDEQWRIWDSQAGKTYTIKHNDTQLTVFEEPYDRLVNLTPPKTRSHLSLPQTLPQARLVFY